MLATNSYFTLKMNCETFNLDCTDAYYQALEPKLITASAPPENNVRLVRHGQEPNVVWRVKRQLPGRRSAGPRWVEHFAVTLCKLDFSRYDAAPQFFCSLKRQIGVELHVDDIQVCGETSNIREFGRAQVMMSTSKVVTCMKLANRMMT